MTDDFEIESDGFSGFGVGRSEDFQQAQFLSIHFDGKWRFDHSTGLWHHWTGIRWAPDRTDRILHAVAKVATKSMVGATDEQKKSLFRLLNTSAQNNALKALASFPEYSTDGDDWDQDPFLLGCSNGVIDLRENRLMARPDPSCLVTKTTHRKFEPVSHPSEFHDRAPIFMDKMAEWTSKDGSMIGFLLSWFGSSLFGYTPEQRFLLMTGIGRNGKGTLKNTVLQAVGEYGEQLDANLYMRTKYGAARSDGARADLIKLKGLRLAFFSEPEGNKFNEELLKAHTGGDRITARPLYSNAMSSWNPTHSITFLTNDAPEVDDIGPSMAARVMVADFRERYDGERMDRSLQERLNAEADGVLAILCYMAQHWYERFIEDGTGILTPKRVEEQTIRFMAQGDPIAMFVDEACDVGPEANCSATALYEAYMQWHARSGRDDEASNQTRFGKTMEKKGFAKRRTSSGYRYLNISPLGAMRLALKGVDEEDGD